MRWYSYKRVERPSIWDPKTGQRAQATRACQLIRRADGFGKSSRGRGTSGVRVSRFRWALILGSGYAIARRVR